MNQSFKTGRSFRGSDDHLGGDLRHARDRTSIDHGILNLALVMATVDLAEAIVTPVLVPAVCDKPVWSSVLCAVAHDFDRVTAKHRVSGEEASLVDARLVGKEALVHEEHASDRSILPVWSSVLCA